MQCFVSMTFCIHLFMVLILTSSIMSFSNFNLNCYPHNKSLENAWRRLNIVMNILVSTGIIYILDILRWQPMLRHDKPKTIGIVACRRMEKEADLMVMIIIRSSLRQVAAMLLLSPFSFLLSPSQTNTIHQAVVIESRKDDWVS